MAVFSGVFGFPGSYIIIDFQGVKQADRIWATNIPITDPDSDIIHGYLKVNPRLMREHRSFVHRVLGAEWLELMVGIRDKTESQYQFRVDQKIPLMCMLDSADRPACWVDRETQRSRVRGALRDLLAPEIDLRNFGEELQFDFGSRSSDVVEDQLIAERLSKVVEFYCQRRAVPADIVWQQVEHIFGLER